MLTDRCNSDAPISAIYGSASIFAASAEFSRSHKSDLQEHKPVHAVLRVLLEAEAERKLIPVAFHPYTAGRLASTDALVMTGLGVTSSKEYEVVVLTVM